MKPKKITKRERDLAYKCKYMHNGSINWLGKKLKSRHAAYVLLARLYLKHHE